MTFAAEKLEITGQAEICAVLNTALAETTVATMMAQNFHWNVTGMNFASLHQQFQEVYEDHFAGQDDLAERIKALDGHADGNLARMLERSSIAEPQGTSTPVDMIAALLSAEETLAATLKSSGALAADHGDTLTEDLCIARGHAHEKLIVPEDACKEHITQIFHEMNENVSQTARSLDMHRRTLQRLLKRYEIV